MLAEGLQLETVRPCLVGGGNPHRTTRSRPALRRSRREPIECLVEPTRAADARLHVDRVHDQRSLASLGLQMARTRDRPNARQPSVASDGFR
jgi:hypothetical protein